MSDVKRFRADLCVHPIEAVAASDYDLLYAWSENAQQQIDAYKAEAQALREEVEALRARVVVDERAEFEKFAAEWSPQFSRAGKHVTGGRWVYHNHWQQNMWETWQARARLNGKTVSEGLLRRLSDIFPADMGDDGSGRAGWLPHVRETVAELRALLGEGKE